MIEVTVQKSPENDLMGLGYYSCRVCCQRFKTIFFLKWASSNSIRTQSNVQMCKSCLGELRSKIDALTLLLTAGENTRKE
jgi:hypothetical protein